MWKKLTALDLNDNRSDLWISDQAKLLAVKGLGPSHSLLVLEGGSELRVLGSAEDIIGELTGIQADDSADPPAGSDGSTTSTRLIPGP